jgi:hypothetical protein
VADPHRKEAKARTFLRRADRGSKKSPEEAATGGTEQLIRKQQEQRRNHQAGISSNMQGAKEEDSTADERENADQQDCAGRAKPHYTYFLEERNYS